MKGDSLEGSGLTPMYNPHILPLIFNANLTFCLYRFHKTYHLQKYMYTCRQLQKIYFRQNSEKIVHLNNKFHVTTVHFED